MMRFYSVTNMYLSSIQVGIQTAHCVGEMSLKIFGNKLVSQWLHTHKTIICLNGGNNKSLNDFYDTIRYQNQFPTAVFYEDDQSMGGMLTCVGIILPNNIYEADLNDPYLIEKLGDAGFAIAQAVKRMPLAR